MRSDDDVSSIVRVAAVEFAAYEAIIAWTVNRNGPALERAMMKLASILANRPKPSESVAAILDEIAYDETTFDETGILLKAAAVLRAKACDAVFESKSATRIELLGAEPNARGYKITTVDKPDETCIVRVRSEDWTVTNYNGQVGPDCWSDLFVEYAPGVHRVRPSVRAAFESAAPVATISGTHSAYVETHSSPHPPFIVRIGYAAQFGHATYELRDSEYSTNRCRITLRDWTVCTPLHPDNQIRDPLKRWPMIFHRTVHGTLIVSEGATRNLFRTAEMKKND